MGPAYSHSHPAQVVLEIFLDVLGARRVKVANVLIRSIAIQRDSQRDSSAGEDPVVVLFCAVGTDADDVRRLCATSNGGAEGVHAADVARERVRRLSLANRRAKEEVDAVGDALFVTVAFVRTGLAEGNGG